MQRVITNPKYPSQDSSLAVWDRYMYGFGLGHRLGIDVPAERPGNIPTPVYFDKVYGKNAWNYCNFRSVSIGQGEVLATPIQVANEMAYIANKGWYKIPHLVDSIEDGDKFDLLTRFKEKHRAIEIPDSVFDIVQEGMQGVVERGTGGGAKVPGITICGKTGTVENYYRGVKQPNHAFFCAFAPRENPKIAIMCVVENSGRFGGTYAAPIVGLMIEKYLNDTIASNRQALVDKFTKLNLIPPRIYSEMKTLDSMLHRKDSAYLIAKGYIKLIRDTMEVDASDEQDIIDQIKKDKENLKKNPAKKDSNSNMLNIKPNAMLPDEKRKPELKDTMQ
jgi:penicillin-binding protein 2